jgi:hypothetical protein
VEVAGQKGQVQGKSFWKDHYTLMCGSIPEVEHTNTFDSPPQRRSQNLQMPYSDIARGHGSPVATHTQNNTPDDPSVDTTVVSNLSHQDNTHMSGLSVVTGLSIMKKRMEEIDKQRDEFMTKQQIMDDSISSVTSSVSKLTADILAVIIDMNKMSDKLEQKSNQIIAILVRTHTSVSAASPPRKVSRVTNKSPVKLTLSGNGSPEPLGEVVTQLKLTMPPASPSRDSTAPTWNNDCDSDNEKMSHSVAILMQVDSSQVEVDP